MQKDRKKEPEPIAIAFGMVIENEFEGKITKHVIVELGEEDWFYTSQIVEEDDGVRLGFVGTSSPEYITRLTDERWTKEQILEAYGKNFVECGGIPKSTIEEINRESQKPPRILI